MSFPQYIARIAVFFVGLYLLELGASYALFPDTQDILDTVNARNTMFDSEQCLAVYGRAPLSSGDKKIVMVGASNVLLGLRPSQLSIYFPNVGIHNISVSGSNIKELGELVQLTLAAVPPESRRELTIVLGISYWSFVDDSNRWGSGHTEVTTEMLRYGLYRESGTLLPTPNINSDQMPYAILAMRPFMLTSRVYQRVVIPSLYKLRAKARDIFYGENSSPSDEYEDYDVHVVTVAEKERAIKSWEGYMGPPQEWSGDGFNQLLSIAQNVSSTGAKLVLIDMPLPSWHREQAYYDHIYQKRLLPYLEQMSSLPGFSYGNMRGGSNDDEFYDSAHPRPRVTQQWAERAAHFIRPALVK